MPEYPIMVGHRDHGALPLEGTGEPGDIDMSENAPCRLYR